uniref:Uncharacterized protein n=1 Tax=Urocitellus parryii TaxID=9999 RepID=A0A8D2HGS8_UROPR
MPQLVVSATKRNLLMDVAITVHIAKQSSVLVVEVECHYAQTRLCGYVICAENNRKSSLNQEHGFITVDLIYHSNLIKKFFEDCEMRRRLRRRKQNCVSRPNFKDPQVTYLYLQWRKVDLMGSQDRILLKMGQE